ncbi:MAG: hypothetical protein QM704_19010 [Anaeromyxobacteraceae bacterium]
MAKKPATPPKKPRAPRKKAPAAAPPRALPDPKGDAPLEALTRDQLSVFIFVALTPDESRALVKELGLTVPGFRPDALGDVERCDVLADEIRAAPPARRRVIELLQKAFGAPPLVDVPLHPAAAEDLLVTGDSDHGLTLALWRLLADPDPAVRERAAPLLDALVKEHYGPLPEGAKAAAPAEPAGPRGPDLSGKVVALEKQVEEWKARVESQRKKGEEQREKLNEWLKEARAREAQAVEEAARAREAAVAAARARGEAEAALAAARATDASAEAARARAAAKEQEVRAERAEALLARAAERERELEGRLAAAEARGRAESEHAAPAAPVEAAGDEVEEVPATFLLPIFSREFYDSLQGWDRRIQRAAFKQAYLLAQDHRHPSLRALALEGLPGYYRVRVATDVRLLYRRTGDRQNEIEILSLIDREDLDRYVRQAKTRG